MNNPRRGRGRSGRRPNIPTRSQNFDSNGPEGRVRGNAQQVYEKYLALARDAQSAGDRVLAEAFQQHAEHYYRVMNDSTDPDSRPREPQQGQSQQGQRDEGDEEQRGDQRGERRGPDRGYERRDERHPERRADERRSDERRPDERRDEPRPNGQAGAGNGGHNGGRHAEAADGEGEGEGRESRLRERFNRRNGDGILTRRRAGEEGREAEPAGGGEEQADAGLRKMLGEEPRAEGQGGQATAQPEAKPAETAGEGAEAAPAKPRRRRRTKAEIEAEKEQSAD